MPLMKKVFLGLIATALLSSCSTTRNTATLSDIEGEWDITEVKGTKPSVNEGGQQPFIGFDTQNGRVYGYSGCNRIMSSFNRNAKPGVLELKQLAGTMMACPDMETERNIQGALSEVKKYKKTKEGNIALYNSGKNPLILLKKRFYPMTFAELDGEWDIVSIYGSPVTKNEEGNPFLIFDTDNKKLSGNAGCNRIFGNIETEEGKQSSISLSAVGTTRMACPDMTTEELVLSALKNIKTYGKLEGGNVVLYASDGAAAMVLQKKQ